MISTSWEIAVLPFHHRRSCTRPQLSTRQQRRVTPGQTPCASARRKHNQKKEKPRTSITAEDPEFQARFAPLVGARQYICPGSLDRSLRSVDRGGLSVSACIPAARAGKGASLVFPLVEPSQNPGCGAGDGPTPAATVGVSRCERCAGFGKHPWRLVRRIDSNKPSRTDACRPRRAAGGLPGLDLRPSGVLGTGGDRHSDSGCGIKPSVSIRHLPLSSSAAYD